MRKTLILLSLMLLLSGCTNPEEVVTTELEFVQLVETVETPMELGHLVVEKVKTEIVPNGVPTYISTEVAIDSTEEVETELELPEEKQEIKVTVKPVTGWVSLGTFTLTAYCACEKCCGEWSDGITATGTVATAGRTIAVDPTVIPYGSQVQIYGNTYIAEDCGGAIKENKIDVFFDSHEEALEFGRRSTEVFIWRG